MARIETDPNYTSPTFPRATAGTDIFKKEDVQQLAAAFSTHTHDGSGHGLGVSSVASNTNLLVNGGFEQWQRGAGPFAGGGYTADRWRNFADGTDTISTSRNTLQSVNTVGACAAVTFTKGTGSVSQLWQAFKSNENLWMIGGTVTLSLMVKTSVINGARAAIWVGPAPGTYYYSSYHSGNGTYEQLNVSVPSPLATNVDELDVGPVFSASGTYYVDNAMLVPGPVASQWMPLHPADDFARCLRYYQVVGRGSLGGVAVAGYVPSSQVVGATFLTVYKYAIPTMTKVGTWNVSNCAQPTVGFADLDSFWLQTTAAAAGTYTAYNGTAGTYITAEVNP